MFTGVYLAIMGDQGPIIPQDKFYSTNSLSIVQSTKLALSCFTALGVTSRQSALYNLHGPLPVPQDNNDESMREVLIYPIIIDGSDSSDYRIREYGREMLLLLVFLKENKNRILRAFPLIENLLRSFFNEQTTKKMTLEALTKKRLISLLETINRMAFPEIKKQILTPSPTEIRKRKTAWSSVIEEKENMIEILKITQESLARKMVRLNLVSVSQTPIVKGVECPFDDNDRDYPHFETMEEIEHLYETLLVLMEKQDIDLIHEYLDPKLIALLGHYLMWMAFKSKKIRYLKYAARFYRIMLLFKDEALWRFSLAAAYARFGPEFSERATEHLKKGYELKSSDQYNFHLIFNDTL